jgi:hypothetical protein
MNAEVLRLFLVFFLIAIFLLAVSYLRHRKMSCWAYAFWGTFALLLPAFGPFFVIVYRPGEFLFRRRGSQKSALKRRHTIRK